jgi:hypothetical protein
VGIEGVYISKVYLVKYGDSTNGERVCYTQPVKKAQQKQKSPPQQTGEGTPGTYIAIVPVRISISTDEVKLNEYEDEIAVEFTDNTDEGKKNIGQVLYLTKEKGLSTDEALFLVASKMAEEFSKELVAGVHVSHPAELKVSIKRNGDITYAKSVSHEQET